MKTTEEIIITVGIMLCNSFCNAQEQVTPTPAQWLGVKKEMIKSAPYIFEGTVIQGKDFNEKNQVVSTCIIAITKIYKGSPKLKLGSIKIVTGQRVKTGNTIVIDDGGMNISKGGRYILFCKLANPSWIVDSTTTDNTVTLTRLDCCNYPIVFSSKDGVQWGYSGYPTLDSLYSFFKENGLTVQEEVKENK